jgi:hypothetical protein
MQVAIIPKILLLIPLLTFEVNLGAAQSNGNFQNALSQEPFSFIMPSQIDTLYYPFYLGLQMIVVDHIGYCDLKYKYHANSQVYKFRLKQIRPEHPIMTNIALHDLPNVRG